MMKTRNLLFSLFLAMLLGCMLGTALAAEDFTIPEVTDAEGRSEIIRSIAAGDAVYLLSTVRNLYVLDAEARQVAPVPMRNADPDYERIPDTALDFHGISKDEAVPDWLKKDASLIDMLFWDGTALYGVNELNGTLYHVEIAGGEATLHAAARLDFFSGIENECMPSIRSGVACNGSLYLLMSLAAEESMPSAYRFDMDTGAREPVKGQGTIIEIARYRDNRLLLLEEMPDSQWRMTDFDPEADTRGTLFDSAKGSIDGQSVMGLLYDPWRDRVLLQADKELLAFVGETACETVAYLPPIFPDCRAISEDGLLILADGRSAYAVSTLQKASLPKPLQVAWYDSLEDWMDQGFAAAYPNIPVKHREVLSYEAIDLFAEQIALRSAEIDIFEIPIGSAAQKAAFEKGYYEPLNQSEAIREKAAAYRPFFRQAVTHGDDIAGVPRSADQRTLGYSRYALAKLGLTASDMPASFMELLDFLLEWDERVGDAARQAEITPFGDDAQQIKANLFSTLLDQYYWLMESDPSAVPRYETELAELLDKLSLVCDTIPAGSEEEPYGTRPERFGHIKVNDQPSYLFKSYCSFLPGQRNFINYYESVSDFVPIALALPSQDRPLLLFEGTLFILNPYSSQKEQATQWLAFYMDHLPAKDAATFEGNAASVESELYKKMKDYYTEEIERLETRQQAAEDASKGDLEAQIQIKRGQLRGIEQIKWEVSPQGLEDYERMFAQNDVSWGYREYGDGFSKTELTYLNGNLPGKTVAHEFFASYEMLLRESR